MFQGEENHFQGTGREEYQQEIDHDPCREKTIATYPLPSSQIASKGELSFSGNLLQP